MFLQHISRLTRPLRTLILLWGIGVLVLNANSEVLAQSNSGRKVIFISGYSWLNFFRGQPPPNPSSDWTPVREFLKNSSLAVNLGLRENDFLYFSYSGQYALQADGAKDYSVPKYDHLDAGFGERGDPAKARQLYDRRASILRDRSKITTDF